MVDGVMGPLARLSGQGVGYEMMMGVAKVVGLLAQLFSQGWGHKMLGEVVDWLARIGHGGGQKHGSWTMGSRW